MVGNVNSSNFGGGSNLSTEEIRYLEKQRQEHKLGILLVRFFPGLEPVTLKKLFLASALSMLGHIRE